MLPSDGRATRCWLDVPSELRACTQVGRTSLALRSQDPLDGGGGGALANSCALSRSAEQLCAAVAECGRLHSTSARNSVPASPGLATTADRRAHFSKCSPLGASAHQKRSFEDDALAESSETRTLMPSTLTKLFTRLHRSRSANTHADRPMVLSTAFEVSPLLSFHSQN